MESGHREWEAEWSLQGVVNLNHPAIDDYHFNGMVRFNSKHL